MTYTNSNEDKAADEIENAASTMVAALRRLDDLIQDRDARIEELEGEIENLKAELKELQ
jgi:peptidoglycan hydrolase CwlO-like protein